MAWRQPALHVAPEGQHADEVTLIERHLGQAQRRVDRVVELAAPVALSGHVPSAVEQQDHLLVALGLVLANEGFASACGGLPVDAAAIVSRPVLAQRLELAALGSHPLHSAAHLILGARELQRITGEHGEIGEDLH